MAWRTCTVCGGRHWSGTEPGPCPCCSGHRGGIVRDPQWRMLRPHDGFRINAELMARLEREAERHAAAVVDAIVGVPESG